MSRAVWKFDLRLGANEIEMPRGAQILAVHEQQGCVRLWARVNPRDPVNVIRSFHVVGTGHPCGLGQYVGTAFCDPFVWHVFEGSR